MSSTLPNGQMPDGSGEHVLPGRLVALVETLADELAGRLSWPADRDEISKHITAALLDLRGSVAFDSLAEMAGKLAEHRLAAHRLAAHRQPDQPFTDPALAPRMK